MPPRRYSRHTFTRAYLDDDENLVLTEPEPYRFKALDDNQLHVVNDGDTVFTLAGKYFKGVSRPAGLWWVIADFQPDPIHDPTLKLAAGSILVIPSLRTVIEEIFNERRRDL
jgi:hypothetical protein